VHRPNEGVRNAVLSALLALLALSLPVPRARADGFSLASVSYEYVPEAELVLTGAEEDDLKSTARTSTIKLNLPILLHGRDRVLLNALTLRLLDQHYLGSKSGADTFRPENLYTFKWGLVYRHVLGERWSGAVLLQPALLSDLEHVDRDHFSLRAGFVLEQERSAAFKWGAGLGYSDDFGRRVVLPGLRLEWSPGAWTFQLDAPQTLDVWRNLPGGWRVGIDGKVTGGTFRIGQAGDVGGLPVQGGLVRYSIVNIGPAVAAPLGHRLVLELNGGTSVYRRFEVEDSDGKTLEDSKYESTFFLKSTLSFRI